MNHTVVQLHFVKGVINHRLRFGKPINKTKLDKYRSIAVMPTGSLFGYIRWQANEYGTIDWRVYVLKAQESGYISEVIGITPAVKVLVSVQGKAAVKRCLEALDALEMQSGGSLESVPESYWSVFNNALLLRKTPRELPRNHLINGAVYAR
jgi:hypothetical protein